MHSDALEDSYHVQMIVNLLVRFPEIFTISFNLAAASCSLSYMIKQELKKEKYISFRHQLEENLETYHFLQNKHHRKTAVRKKSFRGLTQIEIVLNGTQVCDEISLITRLIRELFGENLISEIRPEDAALVEDGTEKWEEMFEFSLNRSQSHHISNLFAFRDAGKVYVYDK
jgi:hypothetical protein